MKMDAGLCFGCVVRLATCVCGGGGGEEGMAAAARERGCVLRSGSSGGPCRCFTAVCRNYDSFLLALPLPVPLQLSPLAPATAFDPPLLSLPLQLPLAPATALALWPGWSCGIGRDTGAEVGPARRARRSCAIAALRCWAGGGGGRAELVELVGRRRGGWAARGGGGGRRDALGRVCAARTRQGARTGLAGQRVRPVLCALIVVLCRSVG